MNKIAAVWLNGLCFGLFHLSIYRFFPTFLMGTVLSSVTLRANSLYPAMVCHFINNAATLVLGQYFDTPTPLSKSLMVLFAILAVGGFIVGMNWVGKQNRRVEGTQTKSTPLDPPDP